MSSVEIKVYREITDEINEVFPQFIKQNFTEIDFDDPDVIAEMNEWY